MKLLAVFLLALAVLVLAEHRLVADQGWQDNQDGSGFILYDVGTVSANNLTGGGPVLSDPGTGTLINGTIPSADVVGPPNAIAYFDITTGFLVGTPADMAYVNSQAMFGPNRVVSNSKMVVSNNSGANNGRVTIVNDASFGSSSASAVILQSDDGSVATVGRFSSTDTVYGSDDTVIENSNATGEFVLACGSPTPVKVLEQNCDGGLTLLDSTPAVSASTRCGIASIGGVLNQSCHGSTWAPFGSGSGTVTAVSATAPLFITGGASPTPNVTIQGSIVSGSTSTSAINLGTSVSNAILACSTSSSVCTPTGVTVAGGLAYNTGTATETLGSFTCGAGTFVNSSSTSGLACTTPGYPVTSVTGANGVTCSPTTGAVGCTIANATCGTNTFVSSASSGSGLVCTQPSFSNLSGSATCAQLPALTGGVTSSAGSCATTVASVPCAALPAFGGDLSSAGGTCSVQVQAIEETSGPARLAINAIPDLGSGNVAVLNRPGGTGTVVGTDSRGLPVAETIHYLMDIPAWPVNQGWIATSQPNKFYNGIHVEYPVAHAVKTVTLIADLITNGLTTSGVTAAITQNGASVVGAVFNMSTSTATGTYSSGPVTLSSSATTDTFGVDWTNSAAGSVLCSFTVILQ